MDTVPPGAVQNLRAEPLADDSVDVHWSAPGDDEYAGRAAHYQVRFSDSEITETSWERATPVADIPPPSVSGSTDHLEIGPLLPGRWYFALKSADEEMNWSGLSNVAFADVGDTIPPGVVSDLAVFAFDETTVSLTWTAPGDDGTMGLAAAYDLRYAETPISDESWDDALRFEAAPSPSRPGTRESATIDDLGTDREYHFALRTLDNGGNRSALSNQVVAKTSSDTFPPGAVTDLAVTFEAGRSINLRWTAPGNNGTQGQASAYDLRYANVPITSETWDQATPVNEPPSPSLAGTLETYTIWELELDTTYHLALRAVDDVGNWSEVSNSVFGTTTSLAVLASDLGFVFTPDWEPDGRRIAFSATAGKQFQVYLIPANGGAVELLTMHPHGISNPRWSPSGNQLAVNVRRSAFPLTYQGIGVLEPEEGVDPITIWPHGQGEAVYSPAWSPDGTRIAYQVTNSGPTPDAAILVVNAEVGSTPVTLLSEGSRIFGLDWSPNGNELVFSSNRSGNFDLWTLPLLGGDPAPITNSPSNESQPKWSPDGTTIAFISDLAGTTDIWTVPSTGGGWTQITFGPFDTGSLSWSPAGDAIAFVHMHEQSQSIAIQYLR